MDVCRLFGTPITEEIKSNASSPKKKSHGDSAQHITTTHNESSNTNEEMLLKH